MDESSLQVLEHHRSGEREEEKIAVAVRHGKFSIVVSATGLPLAESRESRFPCIGYFHASPELGAVV